MDGVEEDGVGRPTVASVRGSGYDVQVPDGTPRRGVAGVGVVQGQGGVGEAHVELEAVEGVFGFVAVGDDGAAVVACGRCGAEVDVTVEHGVHRHVARVVERTRHKVETVAVTGEFGRHCVVGPAVGHVAACLPQQSLGGVLEVTTVRNTGRVLHGGYGQWVDCPFRGVEE